MTAHGQEFKLNMCTYTEVSVKIITQRSILHNTWLVYVKVS